MVELSRYLFLAGAVPFVCLGLVHAFATPVGRAATKGLSPRSPELREAMLRETVVLTRRTNMWLAWIGFNLSHSLGAVLFGGAVLLVGRNTTSYEAQASVFLPFTVMVSSLYLAIGLRYWFKTPIAGIGVSGLCFVAAWVLYLTAS